MDAVDAPTRICLCGAAMCTTPEAIALREALERVEREQHTLNLRGFELYVADRDAGRETAAPAEYVERARDRRKGDPK